MGAYSQCDRKYRVGHETPGISADGSRSRHSAATFLRNPVLQTGKGFLLRHLLGADMFSLFLERTLVITRAMCYSSALGTDFTDAKLRQSRQSLLHLPAIVHECGARLLGPYLTLPLLSSTGCSISA